MSNSVDDSEDALELAHKTWKKVINTASLVRLLILLL